MEQLRGRERNRSRCPCTAPSLYKNCPAGLLHPRLCRPRSPFPPPFPPFLCAQQPQTSAWQGTPASKHSQRSAVCAEQSRSSLSACFRSSASRPLSVPGADRCRRCSSSLSFLRLSFSGALDWWHEHPMRFREARRASSSRHRSWGGRGLGKGERSIDRSISRSVIMSFNQSPSWYHPPTHPPTCSCSSSAAACRCCCAWLTLPLPLLPRLPGLNPPPPSSWGGGGACSSALSSACLRSRSHSGPKMGFRSLDDL